MYLGAALLLLAGLLLLYAGLQALHGKETERRFFLTTSGYVSALITGCTLVSSGLHAIGDWNL